MFTYDSEESIYNELKCVYVDSELKMFKGQPQICLFLVSVSICCTATPPYMGYQIDHLRTILLKNMFLSRRKKSVSCRI